MISDSLPRVGAQSQFPPPCMIWENLREEACPAVKLDLPTRSGRLLLGFINTITNLTHLPSQEGTYLNSPPVEGCRGGFIEESEKIQTGNVTVFMKLCS